MPFKFIKKLFGRGKKRLSPEQVKNIKSGDVDKKMMAGPIAIKKGFAKNIGEGVKKAAAKLDKTTPIKKSPFGAIGSAVARAASGKMKEEDDEKKKKRAVPLGGALNPSGFKKGGSVSKKPAAKKTVSKGRGMGAATKGGGACAPRKMMGGGYAKKMAKGGMC